jgi:alpha-1,6-mannosyltransferase
VVLGTNARPVVDGGSGAPASLVPDAAFTAAPARAASTRPEQDLGLGRCRRLGLAGSLLLAVGALWAGALPVVDPLADPLRDGTPGEHGYAVVAAYGGLTLLVVAWLALGRVVRARLVTTSQLVRVLLAWAAPLAVVPPLYSRDVYSYVAQGAMFLDGVDPYRHGASSYGGVLAANVSPFWRDSPAPYGPVFLALAAAVAAVAGGKVILGVLGMRLVTMAATAAMVPLLVRLARRHGVDGPAALWLGVLNPLVLAHFVSGAHNDALIVVLLLGGMLLASGRRPLLAAFVVAVAVLLKASAVVALPFLVPAARRRFRGRRPLLRAAIAVGLVAAATMAAITSLMEAWYGWVVALGDTTRVRNGLSLSTDLGVAADRLLRSAAWQADVDPVAVARALGLAAAAVLLPLIVARTGRRPLHGLGLALIVVVLLGPVVHPWYLLWGVVPLAATARGRRLVWGLALLSAGLAFYPVPSGGGPTPQLWVGTLGVLGGLLVAAVALRVGRATSPDPDHDHPDRPVADLLAMTKRSHSVM